jgi:hypothetical protein
VGQIYCSFCEALFYSISISFFRVAIIIAWIVKEIVNHVQRLVGKYGALASVVSFVGVFIYLVASPSKSSGKSSKKKR